MKRKWIWVLLILALSVGIGVYWFQDQKPTIRFVRFEVEKGNRIAIFRVENKTQHAFAYTSWGFGHPNYSFRTRSSENWQWEYEPGFPSIKGSMVYQINTNESFEFRSHLPKTANKPYSLGVFFEKGTAEEISEKRSETFKPKLSRFEQWLGVFRWKYSSRGSEITWSDVVQP